MERERGSRPRPTRWVVALGVGLALLVVGVLAPNADDWATLAWWSGAALAAVAVLVLLARRNRPVRGVVYGLVVALAVGLLALPSVLDRVRWATTVAWSSDGEDDNGKAETLIGSGPGVVFTTGPRGLRARDVEDGAVRWQRQALEASTVRVVDGLVVLGDTRRRDVDVVTLRALDVTSGQDRWTVQLDGSTSSSPARVLARTDNTLVLGNPCAACQILIVDTATGREVLRREGVREWVGLTGADRDAEQVPLVEHLLLAGPGEFEQPRAAVVVDAATGAVEGQQVLPWREPTAVVGDTLVRWSTGADREDDDGVVRGTPLEPGGASWEVTDWDRPVPSSREINALETTGDYLMSPALRPGGTGWVSRWLELRTGTVTEVAMPAGWRPSKRLLADQRDLVSWQDGDRALVPDASDDRRQVLVDLTARTAVRTPSTENSAPEAATGDLLGDRVRPEPDPSGVLSHTGPAVRILDLKTLGQRNVAARVGSSTDLTVAAGRMVLVDGNNDRFHVLDADP